MKTQQVEAPLCSGTIANTEEMADNLGMEKMSSNHQTDIRSRNLPLRLGQITRALTSITLLATLCVPGLSVAQLKPTAAAKQKMPIQKAPIQKTPIVLPAEKKPKIKLDLKLATHKTKVSNAGVVESALWRGPLLPPSKEKSVGKPTTDESDTEWVCNSQQGYSSYSYKDTQIFDPKPAQVYPGAIYDAKDFITGNLKEKTVARKPITITTDCYAFGQVTRNVNSPNLGSVNAKIAEMVRVDAGPCSAYTVGTAKRVKSAEDLFVKTSGSGHYLTAGGSYDINYQNRKNSFKYILDVAQSMYSITVPDKNGPNDFFYTSTSEFPPALKLLGSSPQIIDPSQIDPNWIYVKSVTYGRKLLLVFESSEDLEKFGINVKAYAEGPIAGGQGETDVRYKKAVEQVSVSVIAIGGHANKQGLIATSSLKDVHKHVQAFFGGKGGGGPVQVKPLAYSLSTISGDDVGINFTGEYTARTCTPRAERYKITWSKLYCTSNDDGGDNEQVKAFTRIMAFDGAGKQILDDEKQNQKLVQVAPNEKTANLLQPLNGLPFTFTLGSENAPRFLKEVNAQEARNSKDHENVEYPSRSITFKFPAGDPHAKIKLLGDILEFDGGVNPNDSFTSDSREYKLADLPINQPISLTAKHDASRIVFEFVITPIYPKN